MDIHKLKHKIRNSKRTFNWKKQVLKRDDYNCVNCSNIENLQVHHKQSLSQIIKRYKIKTVAQALDCEILFDINNGETLCFECHEKEHYEID